MGAAVAADGTVPPQDRYGTPTLITPRLGQSPRDSELAPDPDQLAWHGEHRFIA